MDHEFLNGDERFVAHVRVFVSEVLHDQVLATELLDHTETQHRHVTARTSQVLDAFARFPCIFPRG